MTRSRPFATVLQFALVAALVALAVAHVARAAGDEVTRVRVDLDLEQLGLVGPGAEDRVVELEIHCDGARPNHQIFMDGDVLVVRVEAAPEGAAPDHRLAVAAQTGVAISVDLASSLEPEAVPSIPIESEIESEKVVNLGNEQPDGRGALEGRPGSTAEGRDLGGDRAVDHVPAGALDVDRAHGAGRMQEDGGGLEFIIDDPDAVEEVMAALNAALDEAHDENVERLREEGYVEEYLDTAGEGQQTSSWTVERTP